MLVPRVIGRSGLPSCRWRCADILVLGSSRMVMAAMSPARHDELSVFLLRHSGELFDKSDGRPDLLIAVVSPSRHAGHLDAVLNNPEQLAVAVELRRNSKVGRCGIKAVGDVASGHAGCAVSTIQLVTGQCGSVAATL
jgi:hypothetical protein